MKSVYVSNALRWYTIIMPMTLGALLSLGSFVTGRILQGVVVFIIPSLFVFSISYLFAAKAFMKVNISEDGIGTKYLFLTWDEIDKIGKYELYTISAMKYTLFFKAIDFPTIIGIGNTQDKPFPFSSKKDIVYFSIEKETFAILEEYGRGKSWIIDEILDRFSPCDDK